MLYLIGKGDVGISTGGASLFRHRYHVNVKASLLLALCLIKHHTMKMFGEVWRMGEFGGISHMKTLKGVGRCSTPRSHMS
jgi:hypothetical protein